MYASHLRSFFLFALLFAAGSAFGAYRARDLFIPIAGHGKNAAGREFFTALWITNTDQRSAAAVTLTFLPSGHANPSPRKLQLTLGAGATRLLDPLDSQLLGSADAIGAVRIESTTNVIAHVRVYSIGAGAGTIGMGLAAIPARQAIGNGQSSELQGVTLGASRYRLFIAETAGAALNIAVTLRDLDGRELGEKRIYVDTFEHIRADVRELFPAAQTERAILIVRGINGNGRVVVAGAQIAAGSEDPSGFEMSFAPEPRSHIGWPEASVYIAVAAVVIAALLTRRF